MMEDGRGPTTRFGHLYKKRRGVPLHTRQVQQVEERRRQQREDVVTRRRTGGLPQLDVPTSGSPHRAGPNVKTSRMERLKRYKEEKRLRKLESERACRQPPFKVFHVVQEPPIFLCSKMDAPKTREKFAPGSSASGVVMRSVPRRGAASVCSQKNKLIFNSRTTKENAKSDKANLKAPVASTLATKRGFGKQVSVPARLLVTLVEDLPTGMVQPPGLVPAGPVKSPVEDVPSGIVQALGEELPAGPVQAPGEELQAPGEELPAGPVQAPGEELPAGPVQAPGEELPAGPVQAPGEELPAGPVQAPGELQAPGEELPAGPVQAPGEELPAGPVQAPGEELPAGPVQAPAEELPAGPLQAPAEELPAGPLQAPAEELPAGPVQAPAEELQALGEELPAGPVQAPAEELPAGLVQAPAEELPAGPLHAPAEELPAEELPAGPVQAPAEELPVGAFQQMHLRHSFAPDGFIFQGLPGFPSMSHIFHTQEAVCSSETPNVFPSNTSCSATRRSTRLAKLSLGNIQAVEAVNNQSHHPVAEGVANAAVVYPLLAPSNVVPEESMDISSSCKIEEESGSHDVTHFRNLLNGETERLAYLCTVWEAVDPQNLADEVQERILQATGQANLLTKERLKQFEKLVDDCEFSRGDKETTTNDLAGFWDMVYMQVQDICTKFAVLQYLKDHNWENEPTDQPPKKKFRKKNFKEENGGVASSTVAA
uniref:uncharacterized protein n=1 Tax=Myxine glutinosa TaxID=7769 RepID=UPI00358F8FC1